MILDDFSLKSKVAIVTGCSRLNGLGYGMAEGLAEAGAKIIGIGPSDMSEAQKSIKKNGGVFTPLNADLSKIDELPSVLAEAKEIYGQLDILVNNSGIIKRKKIVDFTENEWDPVINLNLKSLFFLSKYFAKELIENKRSGKIINIASMLSFQGGVLVPSYTASKHGVAGLTKSMANELIKYNINVNAIAPGYMATDNTAPLRKNPDRNKEILARIPAGRWGTNQDLKGIVVFLASQASNYINGAIIPVDGGWLAR